MANSNLAEARISKVDEFYTQFYDIENEINAYLDYNPNVFRDKVVLLPCDDPEWSNFTKYFAQNFESLGLKKLISTSFAPKSKQLQKPYQPSLFEQSNPGFELSKSETRGKLFILKVLATLIVMKCVHFVMNLISLLPIHHFLYLGNFLHGLWSLVKNFF